uniref:Jun n=1 Tax=Riptortus pedestris TaxID=329032 RepID=R4WCQ7_RIPPE|nr:jun [Riptortus pedestris]
MVRNSSVLKMEPTFYEEPSFGQRDLSSLKRNMTLDLNNRGGKKPKLSPEGASSAILTSPDLVLLKLGSPELEKLIIDQQVNGLVATTPTPTQIFFPNHNVTKEQESYARGFEDALNVLHNSDSSQSGNANDPLRGAYSSLESQYSSNYFGASPDNIIIKDEPQTVPNINSPPVSPIDMENQERIKLERKRQRNRIAASKCRRRKLERISLLEDKVKNLKGENAELTQVVNRLKEQVYQLKAQVMEHAKSGCQISRLPHM